MKIFISWSGERSEALAKALRDWMQLVLHFAQPWLSQSDIKAGDRWNVEIAKELENCNFGVICITKENLAAPWILFEAGALAKSMQDGRVIPVLLDLELKDLSGSGPLAQFQAKKCDQIGIKELMLDLNKKAAAPVPDANFEKLFTMAWGEFEKQIAAIPKGTAVAKPARPQGEILEELVSSVRNMEMRARESGDDFPRSRRRKGRFHPEELHFLLRNSEFRGNDPLRLVIIFSFLKDEFPWLFELAMEAYRAALNGSKQKARAARKALLEAFHLVRRGPFREFMFEDKYAHMLMREVEIFLDHEFDMPEEIEQGGQEDEPIAKTSK